MIFATTHNLSKPKRAQRGSSLALFCIAAALGAMSVDALALDARTLPKGRSRFSVMGGFSPDIRDVFKDDGRRESAVAEYNIQLSAQNFKAALPDIESLINILNGGGYFYDPSKRETTSKGITIENTGLKLGDALERGFLDVSAQGERTQYNLMYQFGLTDRLSVGFALPFIKQGVNLNTAITGSNTAEDILAGYDALDAGSLQKLVDILKFVRELSTEELQSFLQSRGYNRVESQAESGVGDLVVGGRYKYFENETPSGQWITSAQLGMTVPTGKTFGPSDVLAIDFGQGAWDVAAAHIVNYRPIPWLMFSNSVNFTHRFPTSRVKRVRESESDILPDSSTEEEIEVRLGDKFWLTAGANFTITSFLSFDANYEWYWKSKDVYQGGRADRDYTYLSEETNLYLETLSLGLSFSSIKAFLDYKFPLPLDFSLTYYLPIRGRNTIVAPFAAAELALYF